MLEEKHFARRHFHVLNRVLIGVLLTEPLYLVWSFPNAAPSDVNYPRLGEILAELRVISTFSQDLAGGLFPVFHMIDPNYRF